MSDVSVALWDKLGSLPKPTLADLFAADVDRLEKLSTRLELPGGEIIFDWSKTHLDEAHLAVFAQLAGAMEFPARREALLTGDIVNPTEGRAAEHTAQRGVGSEASVEEASALHQRMRTQHPPAWRRRFQPGRAAGFRAASVPGRFPRRFRTG